MELELMEPELFATTCAVESEEPTTTSVTGYCTGQGTGSDPDD